MWSARAEIRDTSCCGYIKLHSINALADKTRMLSVNGPASTVPIVYFRILGYFKCSERFVKLYEMSAN